jgi:predicted Rossmann-fold nucleotide-binding protein
MDTNTGARVLVIGGRDYRDQERSFSELDRLHAQYRFAVLIHGGAPGADKLANDWAVSRSVPVEVFPAAWSEHGHSAGPLRNAQMLKDGKPTLVIAFPGGKGTRDLVRRATHKGLPVVQVT